MTRSLQKALAATIVGVDSSSKEGAKKASVVVGEFEKCFGNGLDLSEFENSITSDEKGNNNTVSKISHPSASSELLRIKQLEQKRTREQEEEDRKMEMSIQEQRQLRMQISTATQKADSMPSSSSFAVVDALVQMHGTDETYKIQGTGGKKKSKTVLNKQKRQRQDASSSRRQHHVKRVIKKSQRIKY